MSCIRLDDKARSSAERLLRHPTIALFLVMVQAEHDLSLRERELANLPKYVVFDEEIAR